MLSIIHSAFRSFIDGVEGNVDNSQTANFDDTSSDSGANLAEILDNDQVDWDAVENRIASHPEEASSPRTPGGGPTPLCVAIDRDAPPQVIAAILAAHPRAARELVNWHSRLTPLYLAVARVAPPKVVRLILNAHPAAASQPVFNGCLPLHAASDVETARMLIEAFPRGVSWRNSQGYLPLHRVSYAADSTPDVVELLIEAGSKQNLGGRNGGGGVFLETAQGITALSAVCCTITGGAEVDEFRSISEPALLSRRAQIKWGKLEAIVRAAMSTREGRKRNWQWRSPTKLNDVDQRESEQEFRIVHSVISLNCPFLVVSHALRTHPSQSAEQDELGRPALSLATCRGDTPGSIIRLLLDETEGGYPGAASIVDHFGRLPLHYAVQSGRSYDGTMKALIHASPQALETKDGNLGLYPFMMASHDVDLAYNLLRESPWLIRMAVGDDFRPRQIQAKHNGTGKRGALLITTGLLLPVIAVLLQFWINFLTKHTDTLHSAKYALAWLLKE